MVTKDLDATRGVVSSLCRSKLGTLLPIVEQPRPEEGQLSSLLLGWNAWGQGKDWVMSCLVDHPFVSEQTIKRLVDATIAEPQAKMWCPSYQRRGGHPVIFSAALMPALRECSLEEGPRELIRGLGRERCWVETDDPTILWDTDTPEDYERNSGKFLKLTRGPVQEA